MNKSSPTLSIEHSFWPVKSCETSSIDGSPASMIHHKVFLSKRDKLIVYYSKLKGKPYGVSPSRRVLSPELLLKRYDYVRDCLKFALGLTPLQRQATLALLRYWAYYGAVYPKAAQVCSDEHIGKATYWRVIGLLRDIGLVTVVNRFILRPHAQISNLYKLDNLVKLIAKYLAEHTGHIWPEWLMPYLRLPWPTLWAVLTQMPEGRTDP